MGRHRTFERYVAIGDSSTEGLDDPDGLGGYHGWASRLAGHIAAAQDSPLWYANLAIRGCTTARIREEQLEAALDLRPDLVTLFSGTNDVVGWRFDISTVACDIETMHHRLIGAGATVVTFTLPDLSVFLPLARPISGRIRALNNALRQIAASSGAILVDFARHPVGCDPRLWSPDRIHANSAGHARIAAALAQALELPGTDSSWCQPLDVAPPKRWRAKLADEIRWGVRYFLPWVWRHARGKSSGDGRGPPRPQLVPVATACGDGE